MCEQQIISQIWGDFVCEQSQLANNIISVVVDNEGDNTNVAVTASLSPVSVQLMITIQDIKTEERTVIITHNRTSIDNPPVTSNYSVAMISTEEIVDVSLVVEEDDNYKYILEKTIN